MMRGSETGRKGHPVGWRAPGVAFELRWRSLVSAGTPHHTVGRVASRAGFGCVVEGIAGRGVSSGSHG